MAIEGCGLRQAAERLSSWSIASAAEVEPWSPPVKATVTKKREFTAALPFRLRGVDLHHPYLRMRGIAEATAREFGIGFYDGPGLMHNRLVIPIQNQLGEMVAYCGRALDGSEPRYRFPPRFPKSQLLFNFHRAAARNAPQVIVVEGFFDCLKVYEAGFPGVVAIMGSAISQRQLELLVHSFRRIRLMLDGDAAGRRASTVMSACLAQYASLEVIQVPDATQPDQLTPSQIRELLQGAQLTEILTTRSIATDGRTRTGDVRPVGPARRDQKYRWPNLQNLTDTTGCKILNRHIRGASSERLLPSSTSNRQPGTTDGLRALSGAKIIGSMKGGEPTLCWPRLSSRSHEGTS
jgi:5S rRNA maturation endonuclease (ribonuclease M5)